MTARRDSLSGILEDMRAEKDATAASAQAYADKANAATSADTKARFVGIASATLQSAIILEQYVNWLAQLIG